MRRFGAPGRSQLLIAAKSQNWQYVFKIETLLPAPKRESAGNRFGTPLAGGF